ncbi:MAG TPA: hypothetical protein VJT72_10435 [Pseudonocardiaceae bacterium]|nr:hypothetical protein [Pseudonocardiaceae bacterium]
MDHPSARNLMMDISDRATTITFPLRDRDSRFTRAFDAVFTADGIQILTNPPGVPRANAICELAAPWRARSVARVLQEWTSVLRIFHHPTRPHLDELALLRTLELAAAVLGCGDEPILRSPRGTRVIPNRQRLAAVAVLGEREAHLSAVQRLALVDAAAWWPRSPTAARNLRTLCSLRAVQRRSPGNTFTSP